MKKDLKGISLYLPGTIFVLLGVLVVFYPMLLVGLFSAALIVLGFAALSVAHQLRKWQRYSYWSVNWEPVDPHAGAWLRRVFVHRRW